ncbi:MAG: tetratricopeptide repeat protein, partial [Bacteroidia bacterium]
MPNQLSRFWQEIKRRNVHRLMAVYGGTAFVIFEASTMIFPRWGLPDWTIDLVLYLLILGAIITFIIGWIYDITPAGVQKTKPMSEVPESELSATPNGWKIASLISALVIVVLIVLNIIPRIGKKEILDKSIAVIPFINDSPDQENEYFINGIMDEILINLQAIKDFRVPGRTSVEQYRNQSKSIPEIASELGVNYIVEGSGQKYGNTFILRVQLLEGATGMHIWGDSFEQEIESVDAIIRIQSGIAKSIATELRTALSPEEEQLIEKIPTKDLAAYEFYRRGVEEFWKYRTIGDTAKLDRAESLYYEALKYDSTFALAYVGLAQVYWNKHYFETYFSKNFLDSTLILLDKALSYDDQLSDAYSVRGDYYREIGKPEQAVKEYEKAIQLNPNDWSAYSGLGSTYRWVLEDYLKAIVNMQEALIRNRGQQLPQLIRALGYTYLEVGFKEEAENYFQEKLILDGDSVVYLTGLAWMEFSLGNFNNAVEIQKRAYNIDTSRMSINNTLLLYYSITGQDKAAFMYAEKYNKYIA